MIRARRFLRVPAGPKPFLVYGSRPHPPKYQEMKRMRGDNSTPNSQATPPKNAAWMEGFRLGVEERMVDL